MTEPYTYPIYQTAVVLVDPLNEFFSPEGKLWGMTENIVRETGTFENLTRLANVPRNRGLKKLSTHCITRIPGTITTAGSF